MKQYHSKIFPLICLAGLAGMIFACNKTFLQREPTGAVSESLLANKNGVNQLLIGAYSMLDGIGGVDGNVQSSADNWVWGSMAADDANKGSDPSDNAPDMQEIETWKYVATSTYEPVFWSSRYDGVQRCNEILRVLKLTKDMTAADTAEIAGEARFLRGHYYFDLKKVFNHVPYLDENHDYQDGTWHVSNTADIWPYIEADFKYAMQSLPATQPEAGRANKYAAEAYLAKAYMFEHKYADAKPLLEDLIANGVTANGQKYALNARFSDNFDGVTRNSAEAIFSCEYSINDGSQGATANFGDALNFPLASGAPGGCCGWFQPTYSLVNSYKTDPVTGLPDPVHYNDVDVKNDEGLLSSDPFTPYTGTVDPRLDWTVGRRGIPYLDWGPMPGHSWIRNQAFAGPYISKKTSYYKATANTDAATTWTALTNDNYTFIRFAQVILWAAECEVETGSLDKAEGYVNQIRARASNPNDFVRNPDGSPAANYFVKLYPPGYFTAQGKDISRGLVHFEEKLELATEGHRFFDLVRWGIADSILNNVFVPHESIKFTLLKGAFFEKGKAEYFPIPQAEIDKSVVNGKPMLIQNPLP